MSARSSLRRPRHESFAEEWRPVLRPRQGHLVCTDLREQRLQWRLRRFNRVSRLESREHLDPSRALIVHVHPFPLGHEHRLHLDGNANLRRTRRIETGKARRRHADDRHRVVVDEDLLADDRVVPVEAPHPVVVSQHDDGMTLVDLIVLLRAEHATNSRLDAKHREVVAGHHLGIETFSGVVDAHRRGDQPTRNHFGQRLGALLVLPVNRVGVLAQAHVAAAMRALLVQHHELFRDS